MRKVVLVFLLLTAVAYGQTTAAPVPAIDFAATLNGLDGKPISLMADKTPFTLGDAAVAALEDMTDSDKNASGLEKFKLDELARKIYGKKHVVLHPEEITLIKERIGKIYGPVIVGAAWRLLDPAMDEKKGQ